MEGMEEEILCEEGWRGEELSGMSREGRKLIICKGRYGEKWGKEIFCRRSREEG